jgi:hypothetical protein
MRGFLAVLGREVAERRLLVAASLLLGLVPLAAPWMPGAGHLERADVRSGTAVALAVCFSFGLALLLGASVVSRDLAERRLGFYFSRPIGGWAIWSGKLLSAAFLALAAGALILLPAVALERRLDVGVLLSARLLFLPGDFPTAAVTPLLWAAAVVLVVLVSHAAGVSLRSRSPWLLLDFAGLGLVSWLVWAVRHRLIFAGAFGAAAAAAVGLLAAGLLALVGAGATQVLGGRTDVRRGHRLLSLTLWGTLLTASVGAQGYASWVLAAEPDDLETVAVTAAASRGPWIALTGKADRRNGYHPEFLVDVSSGRFAPVRTGTDLWAPPRLSADGRWAVWMESRAGAYRSGVFELLRMDLRDPRSGPERTGMTYPAPVYHFAVSADGRRVAVASGRRLTVEEVPSGRILASAELPRQLERYQDSLRFASSDRVQIFGGDLFSNVDASPEPVAFEVGEMRIAGGGIVRTARLEQVVAPRVAVDGTRILARRRGYEPFVVFDAGSGAALAELPAGGRESWATFLADGRIALVSGVSGKELRILSPAFAPERTFRFNIARSLRLGGQPAPDHLVVAMTPRGPETARWDLGRTVILDLGTGAMRKLGTGLLPAAGSLWGPEAAASRLFLDREGRLVQVDLSTGRRRVVAGRRAG